MLSTRNIYLLVLFFLAAAHARAQDLTINLKAAGIQYDLVQLTVNPGATVKFVLTNNDDMKHNMVVTQPAAREEIVNAALAMGEAGEKANYVPQSTKVLGFIPLIGPGETGSVTIKMPEKAGVYPYVCTFPGHGFIMFGAIYVNDRGTMPALKDDRNVPPARREESAAKSAASMAGMDHSKMNHTPSLSAGGHPYPLTPPYVLRAFMPGTGPDAIGVMLPQQMNYCWDATTCRLRYAWKGAGLDFSDFWKSYKKYAVEIVGTTFYRDKTQFPLHIDQPTNMPTVKFKGYDLIARYPEFNYTINGLDVYELIRAKPDGSGLTRTFRIPNTTKPIWFTFGADDGVTYTCSKGKWINGKLMLTAEEAHQFTIIMTKKEGIKL